MRVAVVTLLAAVSVAVLGVTAAGRDGLAASGSGGPAAPAARVLPGTGDPGAADGELVLGALTGTGGRLVGPQIQLEDMTMDARDVVVDGARITMGSVVVEGRVPFESVSAQLGPDVHVGAAGGDRARVVRTVEVLGQEVPLSATGRVEAVDGQVVVEPTSVDVAGPRWLRDLLGRGAARLVTIEHTLPGLPAGLRLEAVEVARSGFEVRLSGSDVVLGG